jgi:pimeloyl-ACP methyl ester carboxylesterase
MRTDTIDEHSDEYSRRDFLRAGAAGITGLAVAPATLAPAMLAAGGERDEPHRAIVLAGQGSFMVGGTVITGQTGDTFHGDHAYVQYQIPSGARALPLVMWHGGGQFSKTWESTPDGRDGYQNIFLRRGFATYILDQPRRGRAGRSTLGTVIPDAVPGESSSWNTFRLGLWTPPSAPRFFPNVQFPRDAASLDQYWRQQTPDTGPETTTPDIRNLQAGTVAALFRKIGPAVLLTHSNSGQYGWVTGIKAPELVKAIIAYEPAAFSFAEMPPGVSTQNAQVAAITAPQIVSKTDFAKLTRMPIQIIYGDNIEFKTPSPIFGVELWRVVTQRAKQFVDAVNRQGGDARIVYLPEIGITGNTHFAFSDLNNVKVANVLSAFLGEKGLDRRGRGGDREAT